MENFDYENRTRIIFGKDTHKRIGELIKPYATRVLFHYGGQSIKKSGLYDDVVKSLNDAGVEYIELGGVQPNPRLSLVREGIKICRENKIDFLLAVGGGSAIDSAKAIAMGVPYDGDVWDFLVTKKPVDKALNVAVILTLPAAGSEASAGVVISEDEKQLKLVYTNNKLRPLFSIMNPELYYTLPEHQIANGICDMMIHIFERYFTNVAHTDLTDGLCESVLKTIMKNGSILLKDKRNYDVWAEVALSGTVAHNGWLELGRITDWASHRMEHELSAIYDVAHGAGLAVMTPAWMRYVYKSNINMFIQFAVNVMGVQSSFRDPEAIVHEGINKLENFFQSLNLPVTLRELGIPDDAPFEAMAKKATCFGPEGEMPLGNLRKLYWQDVVEIYKMAR